MPPLLQVQGSLPQLLQGWTPALGVPTRDPDSPLPGAFAPAPAFGPVPAAGPARTGAGSSGPGEQQQQPQQLPVAAVAAVAPAAAAVAPGAGAPPHGLAVPVPAHPRLLDS